VRQADETEDPTVLDDILDLEPDTVRCPYDTYRALRETAPVYWDERAEFFVVTRYEEAQQVTSSPDLFSNVNPMGPSIYEAAAVMEKAVPDAPAEARRAADFNRHRGSVLFTADPPAHTRHRKLINRALTPRAVTKFEPEIERLCHTLVDRFDGSGRVEIVSEYAGYVPVLAVAQLLDIPEEHTEDFIRMADSIISPLGSSMTTEQVHACLVDQSRFFTYFTELIEKRRTAPGDDMLSAIIHARADDAEPFTLEETLGLASQLLAAGLDTTNKLIATAVLRLCEDPYLMTTVRADMGLVPKLLEEVLRLESPVQGLFRTATADTELAGVRIPRGSMVWVVYASANRDEAVFTAPDEVELERPNMRSHMAFGHGPHFCIGAPLARAEARIALEVLLERLDDIRIDDGVGVSFLPSYVMHGVQKLGLRFVPRRGA